MLCGRHNVATHARDPPTSGCNHALSSVGLELLWEAASVVQETLEGRSGITVCTLPPERGGKNWLLALLLL